MKITVDEARKYFAHPSQHYMGITPDNLPEKGFEYRADGALCLVFHASFWPGVYMVHCAAMPEGWGTLTEPGKRLLRAFYEEKQATRLIAWTPRSKRGALALARRCGFIEDGRFPVSDDEIIMQGWTP